MHQAISNIMFPDRPFFEGATCGVQGNPVRHLLMGATVGLFAPSDRPMRILEVGSWIGFSALTWAEAISRFAPQGGSLLCVDPWASYFNEADIARGDHYRNMEFMGRTGLAYDLFRHNARFAPKAVQVDHIRGEAGRVLPYLRKGHFDLIYVDGSHYYTDVLHDLTLAHDLLAEGGIICGDDLEVQVGEVPLEHAAAHKAVDFVDGYHPGVTLAVHEFFGGRVSSAQGYWYMQKTPDGYRPVSMDRMRVFIPEHFPENYRQMAQQMLQ